MDMNTKLTYQLRLRVGDVYQLCLNYFLSRLLKYRGEFTVPLFYTFSKLVGRYMLPNRTQVFSVCYPDLVLPKLNVYAAERPSYHDPLITCE